MKIVYILLFSLLSFSLWAQKPIVEIKVIQNEQEVEIINHEVNLLKDEFALEIRFNKKKVKYLMLNASSQNNYYQLTENEEIPNTEYLGAYTVAEYPFNLDRRIYDDLEIFNNLGTPFEHRGNIMHHFSTYKTKGKWATGLKEVRKVFVGGEDILVKELDGEPLYLFVVGIDKKHDEGLKLKAEDITYRWKLKINWK